MNCQPRLPSDGGRELLPSVANAKFCLRSHIKENDMDPLKGDIC